MTQNLTKHRVIFNKESLVRSIMKDLSSLSILGGLFYFNYHYIGNSYFVNFLILCVIIIRIISLSTKGSNDFSFYEVDNSKMNKILEIINEK
jgi:hypothetical protein